MAVSSGHAASFEETIRHAIDHAIHLLPCQGPIAIFVHHNTLHAFEHLSFHDAVAAGLRRYGAQPYLSEERYRREFEIGRILLDDVKAVLAEDLGEDADIPVALGTTRGELHSAMMSHVIRNGPDNELLWFMAETDATRKFRDDVPVTRQNQMIEAVQVWILRDYETSRSKYPARVQQIIDEVLAELDSSRITRWSEAEWRQFTLTMLHKICHHGADLAGEVFTDEIQIHRHRDIVFAATQKDCDSRVNELLIRFLGSFTDQGFAQWELPHKDKGLYAAFSNLFLSASGFAESWQRDIMQSLRDDLDHSRTPYESIEHSLRELHVTEEQAEDFIESSLLALPGWTGMIWQLETNAAWTPQPAEQGSLVELLAIRLILDRASLKHETRHLLNSKDFRRLYDRGVSLENLSEVFQFHEKRHVRQTVEQRAFILFQIAQLLSWAPNALAELTAEDWRRCLSEISAFGSLDRRRLFHEAYERHYRVEALDALNAHIRDGLKVPENPLFQVITCIDDREESFRRHIEEVEPKVETFGAAGFFSVAMYFRSATDAHYIPLCPVVVKPQHFVDEISQLSQQELQRRQAEARRVLGKASHRIHIGSRSLAGGTVTSMLGAVASLPMVARVLAPRLTSRIRDFLSQVVRPNRATSLCIERDPLSPTEQVVTSTDANIHQGFTLEEMANMVQRLLGDIGMDRFSRLVIILGHGSSSLNNPHESAYNCGACGGGRGGPNARAFALMANDLRVRLILKSRGLEIPETCFFVGGYHNTCNDAVDYFDIDRLPTSHHAEFLNAKTKIDVARARNAQERVRRFESAPLNITPEEALKHAEVRAEDLAQARPEYNHATNAICFVGRRGRTRGLFMDRRSFLTSYDPTQDGPDTPVLNRILQAVIPVCSGISLEYYFSTVDNISYGCGSKLPHNITSLLGVMEGAASDLRTGLSQQMVEIHEAMRILFIIEATPASMLSIMARNKNIDQMIRNAWVQIALLDPTNDQILVFKQGVFSPYEPTQQSIAILPSSYNCYRNCRVHMPFATIASNSVQ